MTDRTLDTLAAHLARQLPDAQVTHLRSTHCVVVAVGDQTLLVWHDGYGREFYGEHRAGSRQVATLVDAAGAAGIRTQLMYHDDKSRDVVIQQLADTARHLRGR